MAFEPGVVRQASMRLLRRKEERMGRRERLEQDLYQREPELRRLDGEIRGTMVELAGLLASGKPLEAEGAEIAAVREKNLALQTRREELLRALGCEPSQLEDVPACPLCGDTGWTGGRMCRCLKELCVQEQMKRLTSLMNLTEEQSFDQLRMDVYSDQPWQGQERSPREQMKRVVLVCEGFARQFPHYPLKNLLLSGGTGLGKTFLSGCIAREVSQRGYSVVYETVIDLFSAFETRRFTRDAQEERQAREDTRRYLRCDLLILDDLGSEMTGPLAQAALYEVVNSRLQADRRTIISTNLSLEQIGERYTPQITSRIGGLFRELTFYGQDIRRRGQ
ncbi:MAG TPA: ATP-binding protein [Candidatus Enterenecus stercoripullorum]|nr:ATP-binding protein [Candidatus Enterenecus stercoripullorum]